eukprot:CAMPEP_0173317786 /NCGR_PEP_ID=MMETSP1143-20121109/27297_1 /TAXON_ID=483371 /ORGANISM="non described non described, Strain CCMP2298" /LENGTH=82 /DNA_ID=CAMNT_0014260963 /DNA_START=304 /DNA_END=549 /DNA_ORIENTATION=+
MTSTGEGLCAVEQSWDASMPSRPDQMTLPFGDMGCMMPAEAEEASAQPGGRGSNTVTLLAVCENISAHARPAKPPPMMATRS